MIQLRRHGAVIRALVLALIATLLIPQGVSSQAGQVYLEQKVGDGDWSEYTTPVTLSADGTHTIQVRASDTAGNVSTAESVTVKIDRTAPVATVTGLASGGTRGVASVLPVSASVTGALSGPAGVKLTVDGRSVGASLDGVLLGLGAHTLAAVGADAAGNESTTAVPFTVVASYPEALKLVDRFRAAGKVQTATATVLKVQLGLAAEAQRRGRDRVALVALGVYLAKAGTVQDVAARTLLIAVGNDLKGRLG